MNVAIRADRIQISWPSGRIPTNTWFKLNVGLTKIEREIYKWMN